MTAADIHGPWVDPGWESGLIERARRWWPVPINDLPDAGLALFLRQRIAVEPDDFLSILRRQQEALVVHATEWFFGTNFQYLTSYKGLAFYTKSPAPLDLPSDTELVLAQSIWIP